MFGIDFDNNGRVIGSTIEPKKTENKAMIKRVNPLVAAMEKKQEMEATKVKNTSNEDKAKEVAAEIINSDATAMQQYKYCGLRPGTKMPDCKWTTQSNKWDDVKSKSDLAVIIPDDYIVVDIDDEAEGKALLKLVETNSKEYDTVISCVMRTDHGYHFWFKKPSQSLDSLGIKHTSKVKTLLTLSVDYRVGGKGYMVIRRDGKDRQWVHGSWADLTNVATIPNILYPIAPTDDRHKALYRAKADKYGYQVLPDGRLGSYCGLPKGQRTMALLSYYGYLKTFYADIPARSVEDCQMIIYNINRYLCAEPIPDNELYTEILSNTERVMVTADNGGNNNSEQVKNEAPNLISLSLHGQTSSPNQEDTNPTNSTTTTVNASNTAPVTTTNTNTRATTTSYADMARDVIDAYNIVYHNNNYYTYNNGVYEAIGANAKDSELVLKQMIISLHNRDDNKAKANIIDNIRVLGRVAHSDDDGNLLAMVNGVYNTDTHTFTPWDDIEMGRYHFFTRIPIVYKPMVNVDKTIVEFEQYRSSLFNDEVAEDYKKVLDQILGYTLCRTLAAQKIFFFFGAGGTGKSTYVNFLSRLIGAQNTRNMTLNRILGDKFALSALKGRLLNIGDETITADSIKSVDLLKSLAVSSNIEVEAKYQSAESVRLYAKHIYCTNERPQCQDRAFWSRVIVIPFNRVFRGTANNIPDDKLQKLMDNEDVKSYMFLMAMQGLQELQKNSWQFHTLPDMESVKQDFIPATNSVEAWIQANGITEENILGLPSKDAKDSYKQWCIDHHYRAMGVQQFIKYLKEVFQVTISRRRKDGRTINYFKAENIEEE